MHSIAQRARLVRREGAEEVARGLEVDEKSKQGVEKFAVRVQQMRRPILGAREPIEM